MDGPKEAHMDVLVASPGNPPPTCASTRVIKQIVGALDYSPKGNAAILKKVPNFLRLNNI